VRLQKLGYTGRISILKEYVHPLRPAVAGYAPVQRYETKPGEQVQFDWGEFVYEHEGTPHKFYGFTSILGYSRMRFVTFVKRRDTPTLIRCLMEAFEYFGGLTKIALTDRMKSVLLEMEENKPRWNPRFADFMVSIGVAARLQAIHSSNQRFSCILHSFRMVSVFWNICERLSEERAPQAARTGQPHDHWYHTWGSALLVPSP
jgi:transposase